MTIATSFISGPTGITMQIPHVEPTDILLPHLDVKRCICRTARGGIFLAHDRNRQRDVVLKVCRMSASSRQQVTASLEREIQICRRLPFHPCLLQAERLHFAASKEGGDLGIIEMEYADGGSLRDWLSTHQNDLKGRREDGLRIFRSLCAAVGAVHAEGVVHGDIKPENILFRNGVLMLADFGAAIVLPHRTTEHDSAALSKPDPHSGTPEYMSPERWTATVPGAIDERADIYSMGIILCEFMSDGGQPPFRGSEHRLARLHAEARIPDIIGIGAEVLDIIRKCLSKRPSDRYRHTDELLDALDDICADGIGSKDGVEDKTTALQEAIAVAIAAKEWFRAERLCGRLLVILPGNEMAEEVTAHIAERRAMADAIYQRLTGQGDISNLDEAVSLLAKAMECFPDHSQESVAAIRLGRQAAVFRDSLEGCEAAARTGDFLSARGLAARALSLNPGAVGVARLLARLEQQCSEIGELQQGVRNAVENGDFVRAKLVARRLDELGVPARLEEVSPCRT